MYNVRPTKPCYNNYFPTERELIFDIDINDYDDIRTCCTGDQICPKCWKFMALACKILDNGLRIDFGYNHILWVFSGRRGIHCWVCDQRARILSPSERQTVGKYFQIINGGKYTYKKVKLDNRTQYLISSALDMIRPIFVPFIVKEQDILGTNERLAKFLNVIYDAEDREALRSQMETLETSSQRWNTFVCYIENLLDKTKKEHHKYTYLIDEIMLQYTYPRMDIKVTETMNHLLKGPFCVHPKTGKISVPFSISTVDEFSTDNVPTIEILTEEMTKIDLEEGESVENINAERKNYKTSLDPALTVFREFISNLEYDK
ncbi:DNA primase small subunit-like isoform X2 [Ceratina calcarata]|nr:DNA primase small subunit-like isoform X2 [Ceratina calcarata]